MDNEDVKKHPLFDSIYYQYLIIVLRMLFAINDVFHILFGSFNLQINISSAHLQVSIINFFYVYTSDICVVKSFNYLTDFNQHL